MKVIDFIAGLSYRIFGLIICLFILIWSIPFFIIPGFLKSIIFNKGWNDFKEEGQLIFKDMTLSEVMDALKTINWYCAMIGFMINIFMYGLCMILCGIYYIEGYEEVMDAK